MLIHRHLCFFAMSFRFVLSLNVETGHYSVQCLHCLLLALAAWSKNAILALGAISGASHMLEFTKAITELASKRMRNRTQLKQ